MTNNPILDKLLEESKMNPNAKESLDKMYGGDQGLFSSTDSGSIGYVPDLTKYEKYGVRYNFYSPLSSDIERANNQSKAAQLGNALGRVLPSAALGLVGTVGAIGDLPDYFNSDDEVGNALTRWANDKKQSLRESMPIYQNPNESFGDFSWWMNNGSDLVSSALEFGISGGIIGKGLSSVKWLNALTKGKAALAIGESASALNAEVSAASKFWTGSRILQAQKIDNLAKTFTTSFALNQAESIASAVDVYRDAETRALDMGASPDRARELASIAATNTISANRVNIALNMTSAARFLKTPDAIRESIKARSWSLKQALRPDKNVESMWREVAKEGSQEFAEEVINLRSEDIGKQAALDEFQTDDHYSSLRSLYDAANPAKLLNTALTKEGFEAGFLGFLGGAGQTAIQTELIDRIPGKYFGEKVAKLDDKGNIIYKKEEARYNKDVNMRVGEAIYEPVRKSDGTLIEASPEQPYIVTEQDLLENPSAFVHKTGEKVYTNTGEVLTIDGDIDYESDGRFLSKRKAEKLRYAQAQSMESYMQNTARKVYDSMVSVQRQGQSASAIEAVDKLNDPTSNTKDRDEALDALAMYKASRDTSVDSNDIEAVAKKAEEVKKEISGYTIAELEKLRDEAKQESLSELAWNAYNASTVESLKEIFRDIQKLDSEKALEQGYGENYIQEAQKAIDRIEQFGEIYTEYTNKYDSNQAKALFDNRAKDIIMFDSLKALREKRDKLQAEIQTRAAVRNSSQQSAEQYLKAIEIDNKEAEELNKLDEQEQEIRKEIAAVKLTLDDPISEGTSDAEIIDKVVTANRKKNRELGSLYKKLDKLDEKRVEVRSTYDEERSKEGIIDNHDLIKLKDSNKAIAKTMRRISDNDQEFVIFRDRKEKPNRRDPLNRDGRRQLMFASVMSNLYSMQEAGTHVITFNMSGTSNDVNDAASYIANRIYDLNYLGKVAEEKNVVDPDNPELQKLVDDLLNEYTFIFSDEELATWNDKTAGESMNDKAKAKAISILTDMVSKPNATIRLERLASLGIEGEITPIANDSTQWSFSPKYQDEIELTEEELDFYENLTYPRSNTKVYTITEIRPNLYKATLSNPDYSITIDSKDFQGLNAIPVNTLAIRKSFEEAMRFAGNRAARVQSHMKSLARELSEMEDAHSRTSGELNDALRESKAAYDDIYNALVTAATGLEFDPSDDITDLTAEQLVNLSRINRNMENLESLHTRTVIDKANDRVENLSDQLSNAQYRMFNLTATLLMLKNSAENMTPEVLADSINSTISQQRMLRGKISSLRAKVDKATRERNTLMKYDGQDRESLQYALDDKNNTIATYETIIDTLEKQATEFDTVLRSLKSSLRELVASPDESLEGVSKKYLETQLEIEKLYDKLFNRGLISIPSADDIDNMISPLSYTATKLEALASTLESLNTENANKLISEYRVLVEQTNEQFNNYAEESDLLLSKLARLLRLADQAEVEGSDIGMSLTTLASEINDTRKRLATIDQAVEVLIEISSVADQIKVLEGVTTSPQKARRNASILRIRAQELRSRSVNLELSKNDIKLLEELETKRSEYLKKINSSSTLSVPRTEKWVNSAVNSIERLQGRINNFNKLLTDELNSVDFKFLNELEDQISKLAASQSRMFKSIKQRKESATVANLALGTVDVNTFSFNSLAKSMEITREAIEEMESDVASLNDQIDRTRKLMRTIESMNKMIPGSLADTSDADIIRRDIEELQDTEIAIQDLKSQYEELIDTIVNRIGFNNPTAAFSNRFPLGTELHEVLLKVIPNFDSLSGGEQEDALRDLMQNRPTAAQYLLNEISNLIANLSVQSKMVRDLAAATNLVYSDILATDSAKQGTKEEAIQSNDWMDLQEQPLQPPPIINVTPEVIMGVAAYDSELKTGSIGKTMNPEIRYNVSNDEEGTRFIVDETDSNGVPQFAKSQQVVDFHHATMLVSSPHTVDGNAINDLSKVKGKIVKASDPTISSIIAHAATHARAGEVNRLESRGLAVDDSGQIFVSDKSRLESFINNYAPFITDRTRLNDIKKIPQGTKGNSIGRITIGQLDLLFRYSPEEFGRETVEVEGKSEAIAGEGMFMIYTTEDGKPYRFEFNSNTISTTAGSVAVAPLVAPTSAFLYQFKNTLARYITGENVTWQMLTKDLSANAVLKAIIDGVEINIVVGEVSAMSDTLVVSSEASENEKKLKNTIEIAVKNEIKKMREDYSKLIDSANSGSNTVDLNFSAGIPLSSKVAKPLSSVVSKDEVRTYSIASTQVPGAAVRPDFSTTAWFTPNMTVLGAFDILTNKGEVINGIPRNINDAEADLILEMIKIDFGTYVKDLPTSVKIASVIKDSKGNTVSTAKPTSLIMTDGKSDRLINKLILWGKYKGGSFQKNAIYVDKENNRNYLFYGDKKVRISELFQDNALGKARRDEVKKFLTEQRLNIAIPAKHGDPYFIPTSVTYDPVTNDIVVTGDNHNNIIDALFDNKSLETFSITREESKKAGGRGFLTASRYPYFNRIPVGAKPAPKPPVAPTVDTTSEPGSTETPSEVPVKSLKEILTKYPGKTIIVNEKRSTDTATKDVVDIRYFTSYEGGKLVVKKVEVTGTNPERAAQMATNLMNAINAGQVTVYPGSLLIYAYNTPTDKRIDKLPDNFKRIADTTEIVADTLSLSVQLSEPKPTPPVVPPVPITNLEGFAGIMPESFVELMDNIASDWRTVPVTIDNTKNFIARVPNTNTRSIEIGKGFETTPNKPEILLHEFLHTVSLRRALSYKEGTARIPAEVQQGFDAARLAMILEHDLDYRMMYFLMGEDFAKAADTPEGKAAIAEFKANAESKNYTIEDLYNTVATATNKPEVAKGYKDFREIVVGVMSDPDFIKLLNDTPAGNKDITKSSIFDLIVSSIMKMFGVRVNEGSSMESALNSALHIIKDDGLPLGNSSNERIQAVDPNAGISEDLEPESSSQPNDDDFPDFGTNSVYTSYPEEPLSEEEQLVSKIYSINPTYPGKLADNIIDYSNSPSSKVFNNIVTYLGYDVDSIKSKYNGSRNIEAVVLDIIRSETVEADDVEGLLKISNFINDLTAFASMIYDEETNLFTKRPLRDTYKKLNISQPHSTSMVDILNINIPEEHLTAFLEGINSYMMERLISQNTNIEKMLTSKVFSGINDHYNYAYEQSINTLTNYINELEASGQVNKTTLKYYEDTLKELVKPETRESIVKYHASVDLRSIGIIVDQIDPEDTESEVGTTEEQPKGLFEDQGKVSVMNTATPFVKFMLSSINKMGFQGGAATEAQIKFANDNIPIISDYISQLRTKGSLDTVDSMSEDRLMRFLQSQGIEENDYRFLEGDNSASAIDSIIKALNTVNGRMEFVRTTKKLGKFVALRNTLGLPTPENFGRLWNYLVREMTSSTADYDSFMKTFNGVVAKESARKVDGMYGISQLSNMLESFSNVSDPISLAMRNSFIQAFTKYQMLYTITVVTPEGDIYSIDATNNRDANKIRSQWRTSFYDKLRQFNNERNQTGTLRVSKDYIAALSVKMAGTDTSTLKERVREVLSAFGVEFSDFDSAFEGFYLKHRRSLTEVAKDLIKYSEVFVDNNAEPDIYSTIKGQGIAYSLTQLINWEAENSNNPSSPQFISSDNETVYAISNHHFLSMSSVALNNAKGLWRNRLPHLDNQYSRSSRILTNATEGGELAIVAMNGLTSSLPGVKGEITAKLPPSSRLIQSITETLQYGTYKIPQAADRKVTNGFRLYDANGDNRMLFNSRAEGYNLFVNYFLDEYNVVNGKTGKDLLGYNQVSDYRMFSFISSSLKDRFAELYKTTKLPIYDYNSLTSADSALYLELRKEIEDYFRRKTSDLKEVFTREGLSERTPMVEGTQENRRKFVESIEAPGIGQIPGIMGISNELYLKYYDAAGRDASTAIDNMLTDYVMHQEAGYIESTKVFSGDPANYKNADNFFKRMSMLNSPHKVSVVGKVLNDILNSYSGAYFVDKDGTKLSKLTDSELKDFLSGAVFTNRVKLESGFRPDGKRGNRDIIKTVVINDVTVKEQLAVDDVFRIEIKDSDVTYYNNKKEVVEPSVLRDFYTKYLISIGITDPKQITARVQEYLKPYLKIDSTDSAAFITLSEYREMMIRSGDGWRAEHEDAFTKIMLGQNLSRKEMFLFQPQKTVYVGPIVNTNVPYEERVFALSIYKHVVVPLIPQAIKGTTLEDVEKWMTSNQIGIMQFLSGNKSGTTVVGGKEPAAFYKNNALNTAEWGKSQQDISYAYYGIQVDNAPYFKEQIVAGSQPRKNTLANVYEYGVADPEIENLATGYTRLQNAIIYRKFDDLLRRLKANDEGSVKDREVLVQVLLEQAEAGGEPINVRQSIAELATNRDSTFIESVLSSERVENIIMALVRNIIIKEKRKGEAFVQATSVGYESKKLVGSNTVEFYRKAKDGSLVPAQVMIPLPSEWNGKPGWALDEVNERLRHLHAKLDKIRMEGDSSVTLNDKEQNLLKLITMTGFRIPNQLPGSSDIFEVVQFLPTSVGAIAHVPPGVLAKVGSDFDFDKLMSMLPSYHRDKKGVRYLDFDSPNVQLEYNSYKRRFIKELASSDPSFKEKLKEKNTMYKDRDKVIEALEAILDNLVEQGFEGGHTFTLISDVLSDVKYRNFSVEDYTITLNKLTDVVDDETFEGIAEVYDLLEEITRVEESIAADLEDANILDISRFEEMLQTEAFKLEYLGYGYLQNKIREYQQAILTHSNNFVNFMRPVSSGLMVNKSIGVVWDIRFLNSGSEELQNFIDDKKKNVNKANAKALAEASYEKWKNAYVERISKTSSSFNEVFDIVNNFNKFEYFLVGKFLIGTSARNITSHTLTQIANVFMNYPLIAKPGRLVDNASSFAPINWVTGDGTKFPYDPYTLTEGEGGYYYEGELVLPYDTMLFPSLAGINSTDGNSIIDILSTYLNSYVDVAKDPYIFDVNAGRIVARVNMLLVRQGVPLKSVTRFTNQSIIKKFLSNQSKNESDVRKALGIALTKDGLVMQTLAEISGSKYPKFLTTDEFYAIDRKKRAGVFNILGKKRGKLGFVDDYSSYVSAYSKFASNQLKMMYLRKEAGFRNLYARADAGGFYSYLSDYTEAGTKYRVAKNPADEGLIYEAMIRDGKFSYDKLGDYLIEEPDITTQTAILDFFLEYQRQAKQLTGMLNATSHDTFGTAKTMYDMANYINSVNDVMGESVFFNMDKILNSTMISSFVDVVNNSIPLFDDLYLFGAHSSEYELSKKVAKVVGKIHGAEKAENLHRTVINEYKSFILHADLGTGSHIDSREVYDKILTSGRYKLADGRKVGIAQYINHIKSYKGKSPVLQKLKRNAFIKALEVEDVPNAIPAESFFTTMVQRNRADHPTVGITNKMISSKEKDQLTNAMREIKNLDEKLFNDLISVCVAQYGVGTHPRSYFTLIPSEAYSERFGEQFKAYIDLRDNEGLANFASSFIYQFFARHPNLLPNYNDYTITNDDDQVECRIYNSNPASAMPYVVRYRIFKDEAGRNRAAYMLYERQIHSLTFASYNKAAVLPHRLGYLGYEYNRDSSLLPSSNDPFAVPADESTTVDEILSTTTENDNNITVPEQTNMLKPGNAPTLYEGQQSYSYGSNKRSDVKSDSTLDAIRNGERNHTTRYESDGHIDYWKKVLVGDIAYWKKDDTKGLYTKVTHPLDHLFPRESYAQSLDSSNMPSDGIFVFGSNPLGINGAGAALTAVSQFGVRSNEAMDNRLSDSGQAYGLVTVNGPRQYIPLEQIQDNITILYKHAYANPDKKYYIAYDGEDPNARSLNGKTRRQLAKAFANAGVVPAHIPSNIVFESKFRDLVLEEYAEVWSKVEGWSTEYFNTKVKPRINEAWGLSFSLPLNSSSSTTTSAEPGITTQSEEKTSQNALKSLTETYTLKRDGSEVMFASYTPDNKYLSNFYLLNTPIEDEMGIKYDSVEAYYQAAKSDSREEREKIAALKSPKDVRDAGRAVKMSPDFEKRKFLVMEEALIKKFTNNPDLAAKLLATGNSTLVHVVYWPAGADWGVYTNYAKPDITGVVTNKGNNALGKILMKVREFIPVPVITSSPITSNRHKVEKVISGFQTGVDEVGVTVSKKLGYQTGGTTTPDYGRENNEKAKDLAESFGIYAITKEDHDTYIKDNPSDTRGQAYYKSRTEANVRNSDGTAYFATDSDNAGKYATSNFATKHNKHFILNPTPEQLINWLIANDIRVLNVAGNRGSKLTPEFAKYVTETLEKALGYVNTNEPRSIVEQWKDDSQSCIGD